MKLFGFEISRTKAEKQVAPFETVLQRLVASQEGWSTGLLEYFGQYVTPETCMRSPTVQAIVTAVSRRIAVSPVQVYRRISIKTDEASEGVLSAVRERKERVPNHPVESLLNWPNSWQTSVNYWQDATSRLLRYGNFCAYKSRGSTGPIRELVPLHPAQVTALQDINTWTVSYQFNGQDIPAKRMHHVRGPARDGFWGDSPIQDVNISIGLEIAAENFGATFFNNGALPLLIFKIAQGSGGFKTEDAEKQFIADVQAAFTGPRRHRSMVLPKGIEMDDPVAIANDKSQFLETRKYQRTVIAGAFGVPPHLVGDLERATYNNVEQQDSDFTINVVMPVTTAFETAMERDLLTDADRAGGVIIRFNLDSIQRADFKSRQEGLKIQREAGVICPNDWRERENMNPIPEVDGGEDYIRPLNYVVAGKEAETMPPNRQPAQGNGAAGSPTLTDTGKQIVTHILRDMRDVRELLERAESKVHPINVNVEIPPQAPPVVTVKPAEVKFESGAIHIAPPAITVEGDEINIAPPEVNVAAPAPPVPMDREIERGKDGRLIAIRTRPAKR